jgi:NAD dependent epimerase/dehydratase family enzyme
MGEILHRPTILPVPSFALKIALGEFSSEVLGSARVIPGVLESTDFRWQDRTIDSAIRAVL